MLFKAGILSAFVFASIIISHYFAVWINFFIDKKEVVIPEKGLVKQILNPFIKGRFYRPLFFLCIVFSLKLLYILYIYNLTPGG
jgi:hypothetical protein